MRRNKGTTIGDLLAAKAPREVDPPRTSPALRESHFPEYSLRRLVYASKSPDINKRTGWYEINAEGIAPDTNWVRHESIRVSGQAIYVEDIPLGCPARLVLNDKLTFDNLRPGMLIPERYNELRLEGLHNQYGVNEPGQHADSPIKLVVGSRAAEYRLPGPRRHRWRASSFNMEGASLAPGAQAALPSEKIWIEDYDWWTLLYRPNPTADDVVFQFMWTFFYPGLPGEFDMAELTSNAQYTSVMAQGHVPIATYASRTGYLHQHNNRGVWDLYNYVPPFAGVSNFRPVVELNAGRAARYISTRMENSIGSAGDIFDVHLLAYALFEVTS